MSLIVLGGDDLSSSSAVLNTMTSRCCGRLTYYVATQNIYRKITMLISCLCLPLVSRGIGSVSMILVSYSILPTTLFQCPGVPSSDGFAIVRNKRRVWSSLLRGLVITSERIPPSRHNAKSTPTRDYVSRYTCLLDAAEAQLWVFQSIEDLGGNQ
jgi:hypothetical protein